MEPLAMIPPIQGTASIAKAVVMVALLVPWLWSAPWVCHDVRHFHGRGGFWPLLVLGAGAGGVLLWLLIPLYVAGLVIYVVLVGSVLTAYIVWHNARAKGDDRITVASITHRFLRLGKGVSGEVDGVELLHYVTLYDSMERQIVPNLHAAAAVAGTYNLVQQFLAEIIRRRASEADIAPAQPHVRIRMVVEGQLVQLPWQWELPHAEAAIQYLKGAGGMNVEDRRRPQSGKISADLAGKRCDIDLTCAGTTGGQRMQFLVIQEAAMTRLDELGISPEVLAKVREFTQADSGLLLVSGQPKSGITSTMYSILREYDAFLKQLVTIESKARIDLENITQNEYGQPENESELLASVLRRHPDVVLVDRCGDIDSARLICQAASERPILLGIHASDTFVALARWIQDCGSASAAVQDLRAVVCQTLLRRLCPDCKESYSPDPSLLAKANLGNIGVEHFYRARTQPIVDEHGNQIDCQTCSGSGYSGRIGAFELLEMTDEIRELVIQSAPVAQIKAACRKSKMLYLQEQALNKVVEGITGVKEVIRATRKPDKTDSAGTRP